MAQRSHRKVRNRGKLETLSPDFIVKRAATQTLKYQIQVSTPLWQTKGCARLIPFHKKHLLLGCRAWSEHTASSCRLSGVYLSSLKALS